LASITPLAVAMQQHVVGDERFCGVAVASIRPGAIWYSRRILLPSTTPQPAAARAGSMVVSL